MRHSKRSPIRSFLVATGLVLAFAGGPAYAQAPGSPESYINYGREAYAAQNFGMAATNFRQAAMLKPDNAEYQFLLATALMRDRRADEAREFFARAVQLDPSLKAQADAWLATAPAPAAPSPALPLPPGAPAPQAPVALPAPPRAPAPQAPVATPAPPRARAPAPAPAPSAPRVFQPGDAVEVEYRNGFWIPGVVTAADGGACPYYRVSADAYGKGNPSNLGYGCKSVRAPTGVAAVKAECGGSNPNCPPTSPPPLATYICRQTIWQGPGANPQFRDEYRGPLTLLSGGRYRLYEGGAVGRYRYDPTTHRVDFTGGDIAGRGGVGSYGLDVKTPEITIVFGGDSNSNWQCGLGR
jgi:hypothetical protein